MNTQPMQTLRRYNIPDSPYFITCVTFHRQEILLRSIDLFWGSWDGVKLFAWVLLPEHFHSVLECEDMRISDIMHRFKITYSRRFRDKYGPGGVWQNRFWDHIIRDEQDMNRHLDYIHHNPVKHGLLNDSFLYEHSSLKTFHENAFYERDWRNSESKDIEGEFGE